MRRVKGICLTALYFSAIISMLLLLSGCVTASKGDRIEQEIMALQAQFSEIQKSMNDEKSRLTNMILKAEKEINSLNEVLEKATKIIQQNNTDFGYQLDEQRRELQVLQGRLEEIEFNLKQSVEEFSILREDINIKLGISSTELPESKEELFDFGLTKLQEKSVVEARDAFKEYISKNPDDPKAAEAQFYLAESYSMAADYQTAILEYQKVMQKYKKSNLLDATYFRIGESFLKMQKCKEAKIFFQQVIEKYKKKNKYVKDAKTYMKNIKKKKHKCE